MTTAPSPGRASALHRRAMDGVAEAAPAVAAPGGILRRAPSLPGAGVIAIALLGSALGLAATAIVVAQGWDPGAVTIGPWTTRPKIGTTAIDPYAQAGLARSGAVAMSASEGLSFSASTDDTGYRLLRSCSYRISGGVPAARFWTLTATDPAGLALQNPAGRSAFTSRSVIRDVDGSFAVVAGPDARPGNWLPLSGEGPLTLTLRLYDTPLTSSAAEFAAAALPAVTLLSCGRAR